MNQIWQRNVKHNDLCCNIYTLCLWHPITDNLSPLQRRSPINKHHYEDKILDALFSEMFYNSSTLFTCWRIHISLTQISLNVADWYFDGNKLPRNTRTTRCVTRYQPSIAVRNWAIDNARSTCHCQIINVMFIRPGPLVMFSFNKYIDVIYERQWLITFYQLSAQQSDHLHDR